MGYFLHVLLFRLVIPTFPTSLFCCSPAEGKRTSSSTFAAGSFPDGAGLLFLRAIRQLLI